MSTVEVKVPNIGDFKDVEIIELMVKPGDTIKVDQSLVTVESDKASMEIPSTHAGLVKEMKVAVGDKVNEGSLLLMIEEAAAGEGAAPAAAPAAASSSAPAAQIGAQAAAPTAAAAPTDSAHGWNSPKPTSCAPSFQTATSMRSCRPSSSVCSTTISSCRPCVS